MNKYPQKTIYKDTKGKTICNGDIIYADPRKTGFWSDINTYGEIKLLSKESLEELKKEHGEDFKFHFKSPWNWHGILLNKKYCKQMEIIGNKFDNPNLLEEKLNELENKNRRDSPWMYDELSKESRRQGDMFR